MQNYTEFNDEHSNELELTTEKNANGFIDILPEIDRESAVTEQKKSSIKGNWKRIGNCYASYFDKNDSPWITIGPDYWFTIAMIIFILIFEVIAFSTITVITKDYLLAQLAGYFLCIMLFVFMMLSILINPGLPVRNSEEIVANNEWCTVCDGPKRISEKTFHCRICETCIEGYDHHCPWMGKCIGRGNKVWFTLFTISFSAVMISIFLFTFFVVLPHVIRKTRK